MFCPNCASVVGEDQKFCRSCGLQLDGVARIIAGASSGSNADTDKKSMPRSLRLGIVTIMLGLLTGCLIPILAGLESYTTAPLKPLFPILAGFAGLFLFGGVIIMFFFDSAGASAKQSKKKALPPTEDTNKLPPGSDGPPILSVSEGTTDLLETVKSEVKTPKA